MVKRGATRRGCRYAPLCEVIVARWLFLVLACVSGCDKAAEPAEDTGAATAGTGGDSGDVTAEDTGTEDTEDTDAPGGDTSDTDTGPADTGGGYAPGWYLDCEGGADGADGRSPDTALGSLAVVNALTLGPGDALWIKRGTACVGQLAPKGSGNAAAPITVGAYGDGALPVIDAVGELAALTLADQSHWNISQLALTGSGPHGVYITSAYGTAAGLTLSDLQVHDVYTGDGISGKATGLVVLTTVGTPGRFEDVLIDGVSAWSTDQWAGIFIYGAEYGSGTDKSANVVVRNSTVHDVQGDGIALFGARDSVIETSLTYNTGLQTVETVGTPNAIWTWSCDRCTVQYNEGYASYSPGVDGGIYDIDWATNDNVVQYNYGHDAQAYCVSIFGAEGRTTTNAVVRYNVCADNGQSSPDAGDVFLATWSGGDIDGVQIYNNTFSWMTGTSWHVVRDEAEYVGGNPRFFRNNLIVTDSDWMVSSGGLVDFDHNLWWSSSPDPVWFEITGGRWYEGVAGWQGAGRGDGSLWADPLLAGAAGADGLKLTAGSPAGDAGAVITGAGGCDFWGGEVGASPDIGAHELGASAGAACGP